MKFIQKTILAGLAGLALASGTGFYFYKKRQKQLRDPIYHLFQLYKIMFKEESIKFEQILNTFNESFNLAMGQILFELASKSNQIEEDNDISNRICKKDVKKSIFYECLDCSPFIKYKKTIQEFQEDDQQQNLICEDCFDQEKHKGHTYKVFMKTTEMEGKCDCGDSYLFDENSFCKNHKGFKGLKKEFQDVLSDDSKNKIIEYFRILFKLLIQGSIDLFTKQKLKEKVIKNIEDYYIQSNMLLTLILDKMKEMMNINNSVVYCFTQLIQMPYSKHKGCNETIMECLLAIQFGMNKNNMVHFQTIMQLLSAADVSLVPYISIKFMKQIKFAIDHESIINENNGNATQFESISNQNSLCRNSFCDRNFIITKFIEYEDDILNIFKLLKNEVDGLKKGINNFKSIISLSKYCSLFFQYPEILEQSIKIEEIIELIFQISVALFERTTLFEDKQKFQEDMNTLYFMEKIQFNLVYQNLIKITTHCQILFFEKKEIVLKILCRNYLKCINDVCDSILTNRYEKSKMYLRYSFVPIIIFISIISQGPTLLEENLKNTLSKCCSFENQQQIDEFANKILYILNVSFMENSYNDQAKMNYGITQFIQDDDLFQRFYIFSHTHYCLFDYHIFTFSLIQPILSNKLTIIQIQLYFYYQNEIYQPFDLIKSVMFDQSIFINIDKQLKFMLSKGKEELQLKMNQTKKQIINNFIKWLPFQTKSKSTFKNCIKEVFDDCKIEETLQLFGECQYNEDKMQIKPLSDIENSSLSMSRLLLKFNDTYLKDKNSPRNNFRVFPGLLDRLYDYQLKIVIKCFSDSRLFSWLKLYVGERYDEINMIEILYEYFLIWEELFELNKSSPNLFTQKENVDLEKVKELMYSKESSDIFYPLLKELINQIQNNQQYEIKQDQLQDIMKVYEIFKRQQDIQTQ